jgi:hypothetical protein
LADGKDVGAPEDKQKYKVLAHLKTTKNKICWRTREPTKKIMVHIEEKKLKTFAHQKNNGSKVLANQKKKTKPDPKS